MTNPTLDVLIVGGGVMGCATAYYLLKEEPRLQVAILEKDPTYAQASTPLSDGNHRVQFNLKENIQISLYGLEVLEHFAETMRVGDWRPEIAFRRQGNLFLVAAAGREAAQQGLALQQGLGCQVAWLTPEEIRQRFPLLNSGSAVGATFGPQDGTMDPLAVLMGYRNKAIALGALYQEATVAEILHQQGRATGVRLSSSERLAARYVVNCAGAWSPGLARTAGIDLPVQPVKRQVFVLETEVRPQEILPLTVNPSGLYLIHEHGNLFMCGKSLPDDPVGFDFDWDRRVFDAHLWPELVELVPAFERLKVVRGWAGLYAVNTLDGNAILGEWPDLKGLYLATGFSGHGFQQCHAVGRYLAELILERPPALNLSIFSPQRILDNRPVFENPHKLV